MAGCAAAAGWAARARRVVSANLRPSGRLLLRSATVMALLTLVSGPGSPLVAWVGVGAAQAHAAQPAHATPAHTDPWKRDGGKPNHFNPATLSGFTFHPYRTPIAPPATKSAPAAQAILHAPGPMKPGKIALSATAPTTFLGSDGHFEVDVPAGAVSVADLSAAGGAISLAITQIAPGSGSNAGGSGRVSFGSYLIQVVDADGVLLSHGLRKSARFVYHYDSRESALDLTQVLAIANGALPIGVHVAPTGTQTTSGLQRPGRAVPGGIVTYTYPTTITPAAIGLGKMAAQRATLDLKGKQLSVSPLISTPSTSMTWDTDSPVAVFGKPDTFNADLSGGGLTTSIPVNVPSGPGGLTPPVALSYSSAGVSEQHNTQGAAGWLGEGWDLSFGAISWAEHDVTADCYTTCGHTWEDTWQLSDPFGTAAELIPPNINVATFYEDSPNNYCGADGNANNATSYPCPIPWQTAPATDAKVYTYVGPVRLPDAAPNASCFRVYLPTGIMEEFGCTADSLEYYYSPGFGDYISSWNLDLITNASGDQIHITYAQDKESKDFKYPNGGGDAGTHQYIRDAVPASVTWDSPGCLSAQTACAGSSWAPQMQVVFDAAHSATRLTDSPSGCNTGTNLRCDDPLDLTSSGGLPAPQVQSDYVLNDLKVQARASGTGAWNTLSAYQFSYSMDGPLTLSNSSGAPYNYPDPATGQSESVAGWSELTAFQQFGDDYGGQNPTALPPQTFTYTPDVQYYVDSAYQPNPVSNCGHGDMLGWNTGNNGSGCLLWSRTYRGNGNYLATADNGLGLQTTFSWANAYNNTHGVNGGGANNSNPLYCASSGVNQAIYPCDEAPDQNWSRVILTQQQSQVILADNNQPVTTTTAYTYVLTPLAAKECADCTDGMYWGNQNDGDYMDYYNAKFMGFAEADVTNPDNSLTKNHFYSTNGYGVYDSTIATNDCFANYHPCAVSPWWLPANALHGHLSEVDSYDTDQTTLLSKATTQYSVTCPANGVSGTPSSTQWGNWDGNLVSELDHNNPVASCAIRTTQSDQYTYNGAASGPHVTTTYGYNIDGAGHMRSVTATDTVNGGTNGSPTTIVSYRANEWNDALSPSYGGVSGTYLAGQQTEHYVEDSGVTTHYACAFTYYDNGPFATGQTSGLTAGLATENQSYTGCGNSGNHFATTGAITTTATYDPFGAPVTTKDADANGGVSGHTGCTVNSVAYTTCAVYDTTYDALPVSVANAKNQTSSTSYSQTAGGGWGIWPTATTDVNGQTTSYTYDALGRMTSETLPGETAGDTTTSWTYTVWCAATGAQAPCLELDQTQRVDATTTRTSRAFYDGWGHLVETRTPGPGGQDVIVYADYDVAGRLVFRANPYFVSAYTGAPGAAAYITPSATHGAGTATTYTNDRVTSVQDALSQSTTTTLSALCGVGSDTGCYSSATIADPLGHQHITLTDGLARAAYDQTYTGTASPYTLYATTSYGYDYTGHLTTIVRPDNLTISMTYDAAGRETNLTDPDRGAESYSYDPNSNVTKTIDARGSLGTIYAGYDGLNRQVWRNTSNSPTGAYVSYSYDTATNGIGRLAGESFTNTNAGGSLKGCYANTYDVRGHVITTGETVGTTTCTDTYLTSASYNDAGQVTSQTYPNGDILTPAYNAASGWQTALSVQLGGVTQVNLLTNESYSGAAGAMGLLTSATLGGMTGGTGSYSATYDALGRLTNGLYTYTPTGLTAQTLYQVQPTYDALGNVIESVTTLPQGVDTQVFCEDDLSRLTWAGSTGTPACSGAPPPSDTGGLVGTGAQYSATYAYDSMNRLTSSPLGSYTYGSSAHPDAATAIGSAWSASYDTNGDELCRAPSGATTCPQMGTQTGNILAYDNEGQLATWQNAPSSPTATDRFLYDGEGHRVEQVASSGGVTTTTTYIGSLEEITSPSNAPASTTAYYDGLALWVSGTLSYTLSDRLGSVSEAVSTTGSVTATQLYGPYGAARYSSGSLPGTRAYTGQRADAVIGLDYYNSRYYDPVAGQFTSADTTYAGGLDLFGYVGGGPETWIDPSGHRPSGPGPDDCLTSIPCITLFINFFLTLFTNAAGAQPFAAKVPDGVNVEQYGADIVRVEPTFEDQAMEDSAEFGSLFNDNGTLAGNNPSLPESGNGSNGQFQNDEDTAYTALYYFTRFIRRITGDDDSNDSDGPNQSGGSSSAAARGKTGARGATTTRPSTHRIVAPFIDPVDTSPAPAPAPSFWDDVVNWWNGIWQGSPAPAPCACGGPLDPNPEDNPGASPDDPEIPWFEGGYSGHWERHWYA